MIGLCAAVDASPSILDDLYAYLQFLGDEAVHEFEFGRTVIACVTHDNTNIVYASSSSADILLFGSIHTIRNDGKHERIHTRGVATTIRTLYEKIGPQFVSKINGEFVALIKTDDGSVRIATDRLSKKPLSTTSINDGVAI